MWVRNAIHGMFKEGVSDKVTFEGTFGEDGEALEHAEEKHPGSRRYDAMVLRWDGPR